MNPNHYRPVPASKHRPKKEPPKIERPILTDMIYLFNKVSGGKPQSRKTWQEVFYKLSQQPSSPICIRELNFDLRGEYPYCYELDHMLCFMAALVQMPENI